MNELGASFVWRDFENSSVHEGQVELFVEHVLDVRFLSAGEVRECEHMLLLQELPLVKVLDGLDVPLLDVDKRGKLHVPLGTQQRNERRNLRRASHGRDRPALVEPGTTLLPQGTRHNLDVEEVGDAFDDEGVRSDEERLMNLVPKRTLEGEQAVFARFEHVG